MARRSGLEAEATSSFVSPGPRCCAGSTATPSDTRRPTGTAGRTPTLSAPATIVSTPELPKTRSGKIMRRLLRDVSENRPLGDTTTLADPTVVAEIARRGKEEAAKEEG